MKLIDPTQPLWLPRGSVRGIIALAMVLSAIIALLIGIAVPEWYALLLGVIIRDYFAHRDAADSESE